MDRLLNVLTILSLVLAAQVLFSVRRAHIRVEYSVSWLAAALVLFGLSLSRPLLDWAAWLIGVKDSPLALVLIIFCVFLGVFYRFSIIISDLKDSNIAMAQRLAILEFRLLSVHEEQTGETN